MTGSDPALVAAARSLRADATTVEVVGALEAAGIRSILLKGPSFARWLYQRDPDERAYVDVDLLIEQRLIPQADRALHELGFVAVPDDTPDPKHGLAHSQPWVRRADRAEVDLHQTLFGVGAAPVDVWTVLTEQTETISVGRAEVETLGPAGRTLHVALHAAQHVSHGAGKPREDLTRAVASVPGDTWSDAMALAERLDASPTFALGLDLVPEGKALARRLGAVEAQLARVATEPGSTANLAVGIDRLMREPRLEARLRLLVRELLPTPEFMRWWSALARRGPMGLVLAYLWRPVWLLLRLPQSIGAWRRHGGHGNTR